MIWEVITPNHFNNKLFLRHFRMTRCFDVGLPFSLGVSYIHNVLKSNSTYHLHVTRFNVSYMSVLPLASTTNKEEGI